MKPYLANPTDLFWPKKPFYNNMYLVTMSEYGPQLYVNADSESEALNIAAEFCLDRGWKGLFLSNDDADELINNAIKDGQDEYTYLDEYYYTDSNLYLSSLNVHIKDVPLSDLLDILGVQL